MRWVVFTGALLTVPCSFASSIGKPPLETIPVPDVAPLPEVSRADDSQSRLIAEVVVTAQKREENLQDVPISVQAFSAEALDARGINDAINLPNVTPGMVYSAIAGFSIIYIRGIGTDAFLPSADASVATYIDGIFFPFTHGLEIGRASCRERVCQYV